MKILVFYSGGKDSQASLIWAIKEYGAENCEAVFSDTGWENPVTYLHIHETTKALGVKLVIVKSKKYDGMLDLAKKKQRFPSSGARFCTQELKAYPAIDYVLEQKENLIVIEGIRSDESNSRSKMQKECTYFKYYFEPYVSNKIIIEEYESMKSLNMVQKDKLAIAQKRLSEGFNDEKYHTYRKKDVLKWAKEYNADKLRPCFDWKAQEVIDYIIANGQQPNMLYFNGFRRVGCFPCIMTRKPEVKRIIDFYPEQWDILKQAEKDLGSTFFTKGFIPAWACKNKQYPTAEDVEKYLKDKNNTLDMFEEEAPSCMSAYNLCE